MPTPHLSAQPGDFAPTVLMPGDPRRATYVAQNFLDEAREVTSVRQMHGWTGTFQGTPISVLGSGMGIPSISIYAEELFTEYDVQRIIRIGSCGGIHPDLQLGDLVIGMGASTDSRVNRMRFGDVDFAALASYPLLEKMVATARSLDFPVRVGALYSTDLFYHPNAKILDEWRAMNLLAVEMEAAGLYGCATACGREALAVCTVSDVLGTDERMSSQEREEGLERMIRMALQSSL